MAAHFPKRTVSTHSDPPHVSGLIAGIPNEPEAIVQYANQVFPGWIVSSAPQFSLDLFKFNEQWAYACVKLNVPPQRVLIVTEAYLDLQNTTHTLIRELCRKLTTKGFVVVDSINFGVCRECGEVMVSERRFREGGMRYLGKCQRCFPHDPKVIQ
jgi:hypothetical protein